MLADRQMDGRTHSASSDFTHSPPTTGDKMMWFSSHSCKQGPSYSVVKQNKEKRTIFSSGSEEGMILSLYSRQEEKVIWFPGESWGLGQQPLCWRGSQRGSCQVGREQPHAILGCSHQAGAKWLNTQKGGIVLHLGPVSREGQSTGSELGICVNATETIHTMRACVFS